MSISSQETYGFKHTRQYSESTNIGTVTKKAKTKDTNSPAIYNLLPELVIEIFSHLKAYDLRSAALTCKFFKLGSYNVPMWQYLYRQADMHLNGLKISYREDFENAVKRKKPKALLTWADFLTNRKYIDPNVPQSVSKLIALMHTFVIHHPRKNLQLSFDSLLLENRIYFDFGNGDWSHRFYSIDNIRKASPERQIRAKLYKAKVDYKDWRTDSATTSTPTPEEVFQTLEDISKNTKAYPEDRVHAKLYMALMINFVFFVNKTVDDSIPIYLEVIQNNDASSVDRSLAKYYLARIKNDQGLYLEAYELLEQASYNEEVLSKTRAKIFYKMGEIVNEKLGRPIDKEKAAMHFQNVLKEKNGTEKIKADAKLNLARLSYYKNLDCISNKEAAQMLMEIIKNDEVDNHVYDDIIEIDEELILDAKINLAHMRSTFYTDLITDIQAYNYYCEWSKAIWKENYLVGNLYKGIMRYDRVDKYPPPYDENIGTQLFEIESDATIIKKLLNLSRSQNENIHPEDAQEAEFFAAIMWVDREIDHIEGETTITVEKAIRLARKMSRNRQGKSLYRSAALLFMAKMGLTNRTSEISDDIAIQMLQEIYKDDECFTTDISRAKLFTAIMRYENRTNAIDDSTAANLLEQVIHNEDSLLKDRAEAGYYLAKMSRDGRTDVLDRLGSIRILRKTLYEANREDIYVPFRDSVDDSLLKMEQVLQLASA